MILRKIRRGDKRKRGLVGRDCGGLFEVGDSRQWGSSKDLTQRARRKGEENRRKTSEKPYRGGAEGAEKGQRDPSAGIEQPRRPQDDDACGSVRGVESVENVEKGKRDPSAGLKQRRRPQDDNACRIVSSYFTESSYSFIQLRAFRTSRAFDPSAGPTMPSFSMRSIRRAARP